MSRTDIGKDRAQAYLRQMSGFFPGYVSRCALEQDPARGNSCVRVTFNNGHEIVWPEDDFGSKAFKSSCMLLYDLPYNDADEV